MDTTGGYDRYGGDVNAIFRKSHFFVVLGIHLFCSDSYKTPEMNELDVGLSKKSKIIEIGSVKKKLWLFKVGGI